MLILPVVDLMAGQVVRGVGGRRSEYRPIKSVLASQATPAAIGAAFVQRFGFRQAYVADLDAIAGAEPDWNSYRQLGQRGLKLWIDAGVGSLERGRQIVDTLAADSPLACVIAGLESLPGPASLEELVLGLTPAHLVFSLDLKAGQPVTTAAGWCGMTADEIASRAIDAGVRSMIVLDLAHVGTGQGAGTEELCGRLRSRHPALQLIGGGGVRGLNDLRTLSVAGYDVALVASALHDGRLTVDDVRVAKSWGADAAGSPGGDR